MTQKVTYPGSNTDKRKSIRSKEEEEDTMSDDPDLAKAKDDHNKFQPMDKSKHTKSKLKRRNRENQSQQHNHTSKDQGDFEKRMLALTDEYQNLNIENHNKIDHTTNSGN